MSGNKVNPEDENTSQTKKPAEELKSQETRSSWKRRGSRYKARRRAVDILFEAEMRDIDPVAIVEDRVVLSRLNGTDVNQVPSYTKEIVSGAAMELDRIDELIAAHLAEDWSLERIMTVDRAILRVSVWELIFNPDVPLATAIIEGVELASEYSTDVSPAYVHALLDSIAKNIDEYRAGSVTPVENSEAEAAGSPVEESIEQDS